MTDKQIKEVCESIVIIIDTKEKKCKHITDYFDKNGIDYIRESLSFADYTFYVPYNPLIGITENVYFKDRVAIERKRNLEEISANYTSGRERFKREFERGGGVIRVLIENATYKDLCEGKYETKFPKESFQGSLHSFNEKYNAPFFFCDNSVSGQYIYNTFYYYLRNKLIKNT